MTLLRALLLPLLMLTLLPWGAYAGAAARLPAAVTALAAGAAPGLHPGPADKAKLSAVKHCRGAGLPGSPCAFDLMLAAEALRAMPPPASGAPTGTEPLRLTGVVPTGILDPPRFG